jgi:hypothetical protein
MAPILILEYQLTLAKIQAEIVEFLLLMQYKQCDLELKANMTK